MNQTNKATVHVLVSGRRVTLPPGLPVISADNLPDNSDIKYWLAHTPPGADDEIESHYRNIGFGFSQSEITN